MSDGSEAGPSHNGMQQMPSDEQTRKCDGSAPPGELMQWQNWERCVFQGRLGWMRRRQFPDNDELLWEYLVLAFQIANFGSLPLPPFGDLP